MNLVARLTKNSIEGRSLSGTRMSSEPAFNQTDGNLSKSAQVYKLLRAAIISMRLPPGAPVVEKEICEQLDISRTPLREAIIQLATENLIVVKPGEGTFVNRIIMKQVLDGQIARDTLEMRMVRLAARKYQPKFAADFEVSLLRQKIAADRADIDEFFDLDNRFHELICFRSGYPTTWKTIQGATGQLDRVRRHGYPVENNYYEVMEEHAEMYNRIKENDEEGAAAIFQVQIDAIFKSLEMIRKADPDLIVYESEVSIRDIR